ncbi:hypothetical protein [Paraburkholderia youngii]|uniref:Uncharacterized protein n=1 Tax=Paraburkholderia youngii TaxID=2782701 RepID=A0ABX2NQI3_9BURK|nr:hypothetical protein [Paraburkholderia youngii]NVI06392.1 hypothetical protein [Paraburkholderia youngii]
MKELLKKWGEALKGEPGEWGEVLGFFGHGFAGIVGGLIKVALAVFIMVMIVVAPPFGLIMLVLAIIHHVAYHGAKAGAKAAK